MTDKIKLKVIKTEKDYQILEIFIPGSGILKPEDLKDIELPENIDYTKGAIISGKAPVWLFAYLIHKLHIAKWVATYDPRVGAIVVQSHNSDSPQPGDIISNDEILKYFKQPNDVKKKSELNLLSKRKIIALVGPPNSGKGVLLFNLKERLRESLGSEKFQKDFFILRACPDGEGDWFGEIPVELGKEIRCKRPFDEEFVSSIIKFIRNTTKTKKLLFIDCGGKISKFNQQILNECSHAIIVSKDENETKEWKGALKLIGVELLAEIKTVLEDTSEKTDEKTFKIGKLVRGNKQVKLPDGFLNYFRS